jgi:hypothetical protein
MFDNLPSLSIPRQQERSELERYLGTDTIPVDDALLWWFENKHVYPRLSRMAFDYLTIPGEYL